MTLNKRNIAAIAAVVLTIAGLFSLVNYVNGAQDRAFEGTDTVAVYQVKSGVPAGTAPGQLGTRVTKVKLPKAAVPDTAVTDLQPLEGTVTTTALQPGEVLIKSRFAKPEALQGDSAVAAVPKGMQEVTISLGAPQIMGGKFKVGDTAGIIATYAGITNFVQNNVLITNVGSSFANASGEGGGSGLITFAVSAKDAARIVHAAENGKIWLTKQGDDAKVNADVLTKQKDVIGE